MGQAPVTPPGMIQALLVAIQRVVPRGVEISELTPLDRAGIDSLALLEIMIHIEAMVGLVFDESAVRRAMAQPEYDPAMSIGKFGILLFDELASGDHDGR
jgi:acyl carrier protein